MSSRRYGLTTLQIYQTTVLEANGHRSVSALVIPEGSLPRSTKSTNRKPPDFVLTWIAKITPETLPSLAASMLVPEDGEILDHTANDTIRIAENASLISSSIYKWDLAFAYRVTSERLIPFRSSPLEEKSLNEIADLPAQANLHIAKPSGPRGDEIPLLFISRPDGLVIFGSGQSIRRAIQLGLWGRLYRFLRGEDDDS